MRNLLETSSVAQSLDVVPSDGEPAFPRKSTLADRFSAHKMLLCVLSYCGIHVGGLFGLSGATTELSQRKSERQPCAHFVDWMAIRESMTQPNVETEIVANPPDETDQTGYRLGLAKFLFIEKLCNRPDRPF